MTVPPLETNRAAQASSLTGDGLLTACYDYDLPPELIAQEPLSDRTAARMLVLDRSRRTWEHSCVRELPRFLRPGDLMVLNDTRVIPARLFGRKAETGGKVELLLLEELASGEWMALCGSSRRPGIGTKLILADGRMRALVTGWESGGRVTIRPEAEERRTFPALPEGVPPLPPYIRRKGARAPGTEQRDREYYQTVYARVPGAVAAPTAGLHLTDDLLLALATRGIPHAMLTLHVGIGTFKPVSADRIPDHVMEPERYDMPTDTAERINGCRSAGGRIVAVGSTVVRTLESAADEHGRITASTGRTALFIHPPYAFRAVDVMLTNFHLPRSTLLMMVSALAGAELIRNAYAEAIRERYRFYSYGDCMLIL